MKAIKFLLSLLLACFIHAEKVELTVFIHGTVGSMCLMHHRGLAHRNWADLAQKWSARWQNTYRQQPILKQFLPMLDVGFQIIESELLQVWLADQAHADHYKHVIYPVVLAYDSWHPLTHKKIYASFGWSGILHDEARTLASKELYTALTNWADTVIAQGDEPVITLVAHSHGGNVALKLAYQENIHKRGLVIENLVMWGTPIQDETIYFAESLMFKTIINCYSPYDFIQKGDGFSTRSGKSHQRLSDKIDCEKFKKKYPHLHRIDIELQVNGSSFSVDHANLWIVGKARKLAPEINRLPYMLFTPHIMHLIKEHDDIFGYIDLVTNGTHIQVHIRDKGKNIKNKSLNLKTHLDSIHSTILKRWNPDEKHADIIFSLMNPLHYLFK
jgi:pimeloyl-ACP methyl ester carboxylesterase